MGDMQLEISIPADNDGYVLFQCELCCDYFKITPDDYEDDGILEIRCPCCGLCSENYFTEDVIELAMAMTENIAMDIIHNELKKMERMFKGSMISFKADKKPPPVHESPVRSGIEALTIANFKCCARKAKIKPLLRITGCYCPFCGVKDYEVE